MNHLEVFVLEQYGSFRRLRLRAIFQSSGQIANFDRKKLSISFGHKSEKFSGSASSIGLTFSRNLVKGIAVNLRQVSLQLLENRRSLTRHSVFGNARLSREIAKTSRNVE